ncbi:MAG: hypothetical protein E6J34_13340 [Chloroflexi bacterium]|nr:MAG: hypothetical protein E6J34_13340 [Chloroflexota bacterium]
MRRFAADRVASIMKTVGMEEDIPLESKLVSRFIESAQTRVEGYNFDIRKSVVEYDDVIAKQRLVIYSDRHTILEQGDMHERILRMIRDEVARLIETCIPAAMVTEEEQIETLFKNLEVWVHVAEDILPENVHAMRRDQLKNDLVDLVVSHYEKRGEQLKQQAVSQGMEEVDPLREFERSYLLQFLDRLWMDHIDALDVMRAGIGLRAVGQRDPLIEFKNEAFRMFESLKLAIQHYTVDALLKLLRNDVTISLHREEPVRKPQQPPHNLRTNADAIGQAKSDTSTSTKERTRTTQPRKTASGSRNGGRTATPTQTRPATATKVGRNDPCPCGSGKKYKKCHGA